jgi:hypothetical protein
MPTRITPLDVKSFASHELYRKAEQLYEGQLVKNRFKTNLGLKATIRDVGSNRVDMVVDGDQLFGRCSCHDGSAPCEHMVATLLAWVTEPASFLSYQTLRSAIREKDKTTLIDILIHLIEIQPEISQFFVSPPDMDEMKATIEEVADIFDFPLTMKIDPREVINSCQLLFVKGKLLRNEGKWHLARILHFEILNRILALIDQEQTSKPFPENFITEVADDYEEIALADPDFDQHRVEIQAEVNELLQHEAAGFEGILIDEIKERLSAS